ncbi:type-F conjugative transfer system pilin assembly protein TrbC [Sphingobium sp. IP1]|uniref:type-F conjugative transfer system pilin assembly protein TrbC n=1 Tax=Sphingobium sp. IP1 TaxID=2021637 RepID=UPI0027B9CC62|nr:type-F conjugative transfer system pilin assembly protein TrbC [Sphingobium sp. IP1]
MRARLHQALGLAPPDGAPAPAPATSNNPPKTWVPLLFASSSMPIETLRTYARQLAQVGGVIAFRGVPGGLTKIGPMAELTARMLRIDPGCEGPACTMRNVQVVIDPILFRQHGIARVPALAMLPGDPIQPYCEREDETAPRATHLVLGDAALSGLLDEYARLGGKEEVRDASARLAGR